MPEIIHQLSSKDVIFKYANYYKNTHKDIKPLKEYKYSEYDDFKKFVSNSKFSYTSIVEDGLSQLKEKAKTSPEWEKIKSQYEALEKSTHADQTALLDKHVDQISKIIEKEIIARYYLQKGKIEKSLLNDIEIQEAVKILGDPDRYGKLLKP